MSGVTSVSPESIIITTLQNDQLLITNNDNVNLKH